ncbi:MAG TPA: hypothetical protein VMZ28_00060 [Kofleriaceae bacterium]|nr:hypothetical protein [Kofleriaceae bacterium]
MKWFLVCGAALLGGCLESASHVCDDGRVCGPSLVCDDANDGCVLPEQLDTCGEASLDDGEPCPITGQPEGMCVNGVCLAHRCGDARTSGPEQCDASDPAYEAASCIDELGFYAGTTAGCAANCLWDVAASDCDQSCGDGTVNGAEQCDGTIPPGTCLDFGYDRGRLLCGMCSPIFEACGRLGWSQMPGGDQIGQRPDLEPAEGGAVGAFSSFGFGGRVMRFDGLTWRTLGSFPTDEVTDGLPARVTAVAAAADGSVWAAGVSGDTAFVARWDGEAWTHQLELQDPEVYDLWTAGEHVFASAGDRIEHFDGSSWTSDDVGAIVTDLSGSAPGDAWAVGDAILHFDGGEWVEVADAPFETARAVDAIDADHVVFTANDPAPDPEQPVRIWLLERGSWRDITPPRAYVDGEVRAGAGDELFARLVPALGEVQLLHHDGSSWSPIGDSADGFFALDLAVTPDHDAIAVSSFHAYRYDGSSWWDPGTPPDLDPSAPFLAAVWAAGPGDIYVTPLVPGGSVHHFDGMAWAATGATGEYIDGAGADAVYALDSESNVITDADDSGATPVPLPGALYGPPIVRGPDDLFLLSNEFELVHFDGDEATPTGVPAQGGDCLRDGLCVAVAGSGQVSSSAGPGEPWVELDVPTGASLRFAYVAPDGSIFIGGDPGALLWSIDGGPWQTADIPSGLPIASLHGTSASDVFVVFGDSEAMELHHFDGVAWSRVRSPIEGGPEASAGADRTGIFALPGDVYLAGSRANFAVLHRARPW